MLIDALGARFRLHVDDDALRDRLSTSLAALRTHGAEGSRVIRLAPLADGAWEVDVDGRRSTHPSAGEAVERLQEEVNFAACHAHEGSVKLHGAVVAREGVALALVADSGSGKSTLAVDLVRRGWDYLTDEVVALELGTDRVLPYPKPLSVKSGSRHLFPELAGAALPGLGSAATWLVAPDAIRPGCVAGAARIGAVVFPTYVPGTHGEAEPLHPADATFRLAEHAFDLPRWAAEGLLALATAAATGCWELEVDDLDRAAATIDGLLARHAPPSPVQGGLHGPVAWVTVGGRAVLLDVATHALVLLDEGGAGAWAEVVAGPASSAAAAELVAGLAASGFSVAVGG